MARVKIIGDGTPAGTTIMIDGKVVDWVQAIGFGLSSDDIFCHLQLVVSVEDIEIDVDNNDTELVSEVLRYKSEPPIQLKVVDSQED